MKPSFVIIGIGNPGAQYACTRHNVGFRALDAISKEFSSGEEKEMNKFLAVGTEANIDDISVLLLKPTTFMNLSGDSVKKVVDFYKLDPTNQILILCDDIDLPIGELRFRETGGPGTHNGLRSINAVFGDTFARLRIGLGAPASGEDLSSWVLSVPTPDEENELNKSIYKVPELVKKYVLDHKNQH